jgi:hypothetical protein
MVSEGFIYLCTVSASIQNVCQEQRERTELQSKTSARRCVGLAFARLNAVSIIEVVIKRMFKL